MQVSITIEEARAAGVTHPVTSRSYARWAELLRPLLIEKGVSENSLAEGRYGVHVQGGDGKSYLFVFQDRENAPVRDAADRAAAASLVERQNRELARDRSRRAAK